MIATWRAPITDLDAPVGELFTQARRALTAELAARGARPRYSPCVGLDPDGRHVTVRADVVVELSAWQKANAFTATLAAGVDPVAAAARCALTLEEARRICVRRRLPGPGGVLSAAQHGPAA